MTREKVQLEAEKFGLVAIVASEYDFLKKQQQPTLQPLPEKRTSSNSYSYYQHKVSNSIDPIMRNTDAGSIYETDDNDIDNASHQGWTHSAKPSENQSIATYNNPYYDPTIGDAGTGFDFGPTAVTASTSAAPNVPLPTPEPLQPPQPPVHMSNPATLMPPKPQTSMGSITSRAPSLSAYTIGTNTSLHDRQMLTLVTQVVIGEYLYKYNRRRGLSGISENRHERYFWIHPYSLTLYWSLDNPAIDTKTNSGKAKSIAIVNVRTEEDNNPLPPGLFHKSIIIESSDKRVLKLTCPTRTRHNIWYGALRYLISRAGTGSVEDDDDVPSVVDNYTGAEETRMRMSKSLGGLQGSGNGHMGRLSSFRQGVAPELNRSGTPRKGTMRSFSAGGTNIGGL